MATAKKTVKTFYVRPSGYSDLNESIRNQFLEAEIYKSIDELKEAYEDGTIELYDDDTDEVFEIQIVKKFEVTRNGVTLKEVKVG